MLLKLSEIQNQTGFTDLKDARNLADWLRTARDFEPERIDGEISYPTTFVVDVLNAQILRIEKRYPHTLQSVKNFINDKINPTDTTIRQYTSIVYREDSENIKVTTGTEDSPQGEMPGAPHPTPELSIDNTIGTDNISTATGPATSEEKRDRLREYLTSSNAFLWGTIFSLGIFLPFTALNLQQYIAIDRTWIVDMLCWFIAAIWDFSILLFALNGKRIMSGIGAFVMFVFVAAKFDFFTRILGVDFQTGIVIFCIVSYTPLLVHQFTGLAVGDEKKTDDRIRSTKAIKPE